MVRWLLIGSLMLAGCSFDTSGHEMTGDDDAPPDVDAGVITPIPADAPAPDAEPDRPDAAVEPDPHHGPGHH